MDYIITQIVTWVVVSIRCLDSASNIVSDTPVLTYLFLTFLVSSVLTPLSYFLYKLVTILIDRMR